MNALQNLCFLLVLLLPISSFLGQAIPDIIISTISIIFIIRSIVRKDFAWLAPKWMRAALMLWLYLFIRSMFVDNNFEAVKVSAAWIRFPLFAAALYHFILKRKNSLDILLNVTCGSICLMACNTLWQFFIGWDVFGNVINYANYARLYTPSGKLTPGIMMSFFIFPIIAAALKNPSNKFYLITSLITFVAIFLSGERTAFFSIILGIGLMFLSSRLGRKLIIPSVLIAITLFAASYYFVPSIIDRHVVQTKESIVNFKNDSYGLIYRSGISMWNENMLFGNGSKQYKFLCENHMNKVSKQHTKHFCPKISHPHNIFLEVLIDGGIVGMALFLTMIFFISIAIFTNFAKIASNPYGLGGVAHIIIKLFPIAPISSIYYPWSMMPLWLMFGVISYLVSTKKRS